MTKTTFEQIIDYLFLRFSGFSPETGGWFFVTALVFVTGEKTKRPSQPIRTELINLFLEPLFGSLSSPTPVGFLERKSKENLINPIENKYSYHFGGPFPGQRRRSPRQDPGLRSWLRPSCFFPRSGFFPGEKTKRPSQPIRAELINLFLEPLFGSLRQSGFFPRFGFFPGEKNRIHMYDHYL